ncbi:MAG: thiosulfate sulfurtransferase [Proteobacteria bacterium]|nr:thiosulfate sulfurtransferase [Pseudomonadota bacterium]
MAGSIGPDELKQVLRGEGELALLDVREQGAFANGHLFSASNLPLGSLELLIRDMVPRKGAPIVLSDGSDGLAGRAAERLESFGYSDIRILEGGVEAWAEAGYELFTGVNVKSKAFGECVEGACDTPSVSAVELKDMLEAGADLVVLDARPLAEFRRMNIPGAIDCPGAELVYRAHDLAPSPDTLIVVNCAGRTRSIIGAQSLINAKVANKVVALRNGTMGWRLAGFELEHGCERRAGEVSGEGFAKANTLAEGVARRFGVKEIDHATLADWRAQEDERTLYLLDVRQGWEYEAGHLPGALWAEGVQLVQKTDTFIATRGARVVLIDDDGVRAAMTASWLIQMGFKEARVLKDALAGQELVSGPHVPEVPGLEGSRTDEIAPGDLAAAIDQKRATVIDLAASPDYRAGHIPGAWFAIRSRLADSIVRTGAKDVAPGAMVVLTSDDGVLARLAAGELAPLVEAPVRVLAGGTAAWRRAGLALKEGFENLADETEDIFWRPYERDGEVEAAMKAYLDWEIGLADQVGRDGGADFSIPPA